MSEIQQKINENAVLNRVQQLLANQTAKGLEKYGTTVNPSDYTAIKWIDHACEELIDELVYLQVLRAKLLEESGELNG